MLVTAPAPYLPIEDQQLRQLFTTMRMYRADTGRRNMTCAASIARFHHWDHTGHMDPADVIYTNPRQDVQPVGWCCGRGFLHAHLGTGIAVS